jgi:hypothetical protein
MKIMNEVNDRLCSILYSLFANRRAGLSIKIRINFTLKLMVYGITADT